MTNANFLVRWSAALGVTAYNGMNAFATACAIWLVLVRINPFSDGYLEEEAYYLYATTALAVALFGIAILRLAIAIAGRADMGYREPLAYGAMAGLVLITAYPNTVLFPEFIALAIGASVWAAAIFAHRQMETPVERRERERAVQQSSPANDKAPPESEAVQKFPALRPTKTFAKIVGMADVKDRLREAGNEVMAVDARVGDARNGILLFGDPGNGKTMFAEALAHELRLPFINVSFGHVVSKWVGETTENVMQVFKAAREQAPCVLFLDEIDSLIRDRNASGSSSSEEAKTTNTLLTEIVNLRRSNVVLIAATNFLDKLDPAAIREGRFDYKIEITPPDQAAREAILIAAVAGHKNYRGDLVMIHDGAVPTCARRWDGFSAARIQAIGKQAAKEATSCPVAAIGFDEFMAALRTVQGRAGKLPEGTMGLDDLTLAPALATQLKGLAARMMRIEEVEAAGAKVPQGLLFAGPPGTGKTLTARALAKTSRLAFLSVAGNELLSSPDKIDAIVKEARDIRPCIIFIDEADDVLADRQMARHTASVTNRLLTAMDGASGKASDVVWIAATNHPDMLDPAAVRGGRFTVKLTFQVPDEETLRAHIQRWIEQCPTPFSAGAADVARELCGLSIANVNEVLQHAVNEAVSARLMGNESDARIGLVALRAAREVIEA